MGVGIMRDSTLKRRDLRKETSHIHVNVRIVGVRSVGVCILCAGVIE
jgi:hypothetical protein